MALVVPDLGELKLLERLLNNTDGSIDLLLRLYTNSPSLGNNTVTADFTEATGGWYTEKTLSTGTWSVSIVSNKAEATFSQQTWTVTGATVSITGYYVVFDDGSDTIAWAEDFSGGPRTLNATDVLKVTPLFQLSTA